MLLWGSIIIGYFLCIVISNLIMAVYNDYAKRWREYDEESRLSHVGFILVEKDGPTKVTFSFFPVFMIKGLESDERTISCLIFSLLAPVYLVLVVLIYLFFGFLELTSKKTVVNIFKIKLFSRKNSK